MKRKQIKQTHDALSEISAAFLGNELDESAHAFAFTDEAKTGETIEMQIVKPPGSVGLGDATFTLEIAEDFDIKQDGPAIPKFVREYTVSPTIMRRNLYSYRIIGRGWTKVSLYTGDTRLTGIPLDQANILRHIGSGLLDIADVLADIELLRTTFEGQTITGTCSNPFEGDL